MTARLARYDGVREPRMSRVELQAVDDYRKAIRHAQRMSAELARFTRDGGSLLSVRGQDVNLADIRARQNVRNCLAALQATLSEE
jgi:hypothetical protein